MDRFGPGAPSRGTNRLERQPVARLLVPILLTLLTGCAGMGADPSSGAALVRFVEVSSSAPEVDFYVNGTGAAYGLGFESFTSYLPLTAGAANVRVSRAGRDRVLSTVEDAFSAGHQYTVVLSCGLANLRQDVFQDQSSPAPSGQTSLRVLNFVEGLSSVTVHLSREKNTAGSVPQVSLSIPLEGASSYIDLPAGETYRAVVTAPGNTLTTPISSVSFAADAGRVRTLVLAGTAESVARTHVVAFLLDDVEAP